MERTLGYPLRQLRLVVVRHVAQGAADQVRGLDDVEQNVAQLLQQGDSSRVCQDAAVVAVQLFDLLPRLTRLAADGSDAERELR